MTWLELLERCAWQGTLILLVAYAAGWALHKAPAAWRHFLWTAVLASLLVLPAVVRWAPKWVVETAPAVVVSESTALVVASATVTAARPVRAWNPLLALWLAGCVLVALRHAVGRVRTARMLRHASDAVFARELMDAAGGSGVRVLQSASAHTALAVGIGRPAVMLPLDAAAWPVERLRAALLHELMHVRRRDLLAQAVAKAACCLYWFHPLAWIAARNLRREREQACDDAVLGRGIGPQDYAGHLVAAARDLRGRRAGAMAMAEPSELETRVRALLDRNRDRRPLNPAVAAAMLAALAIMLMPLAAIPVHAQVPVAITAPVPVEALAPVPIPTPQVAVDVKKQPLRREPQLAMVRAEEPQTAPAASGWGNIGGVVQDPSGARVPGAKVTVKSTDGSTELTSTTDALGAYQFNALPTGKYTLEATVPGFKRLTSAVLPLLPNLAINVNLGLQVGSLSESMSVRAARPSSLPAPAAEPAGIRVGGQVASAMILKKVAPAYPPDQRDQGISGVVQIEAIIGKDGHIGYIHALGGPSGLIDAAIQAASQWVYRPATLNGVPVPVETRIDISFELQ